MIRRFGVLLLLAAGIASAADGPWTDLFNGANLDGWEVIGDGLWTVTREGVLLGQRDEKNSQHQSWLYTKKEFRNFDLQLDYWTRYAGNSGISIRDQTRARWAQGQAWDRNKTPSHNGYEIQISNRRPAGKWPTGSIYLFAPATTDEIDVFDWNHIEVQSRSGGIRVKVNGQLVAQHPGDPNRPKTGPIGLQLHDPRSIVMFRNIRILELP